MKEAVVDRAVEQVQGDVEVRVGADLATVDGPEKELACLVSTGRHEPLPVELGELGVRLGLGEQAGDDAFVGFLVELGQPGVDAGQQVAAQAAGVQVGAWGGKCPFGGKGVQGE